jgi:transcriptional regulator with XRE-family HTH domain
MEIFKKKVLTTRAEDIGALLGEARRQRGVSLKAASERLGIRPEYLDALEQGNVARLPAGAYRDNYLREYAAFLGLDMIADKDAKSGAAPAGDRAFFKPMAKIRQPLVFSRLMKQLSLAALVLMCFLYLGYYLKSINRPPELAITFPPEGLVTTERQITVSGRVEPETEVSINGEAILVSTTGNFEQRVDLKTGDNGVVVIAKRKFGRENRLDRHILVR